jgi:hypothetical protein
VPFREMREREWERRMEWRREKRSSSSLLMVAAGSPSGRGGISSEGSRRVGERECLSLFRISLLPFRGIFSSPVFWRAARLRYRFPPSCGNAAGSSLRPSNRSIIRRSCCYDYAFPLSLSLSLSLFPSWHAKFRSRVSTR